MVIIVGGKLTTFRRMAQDTVDVLAKRDGMPLARPTEKLPLSGAINWKRTKVKLGQRCIQLGLDAEIEKSLAFNYGGHALEILDLVEKRPELGARLIADLPFIRAEVIYACREEMAIHLNDTLARRMRIELEDHERGAGIVSVVAGLMAEELGWEPTETHDQIDQYTRAIKRSLTTEGLLQIAGQ
jgi:glycerol-3-phosphate dehydrogenase